MMRIDKDKFFRSFKVQNKQPTLKAIIIIGVRQVGKTTFKKRKFKL